MISQKSLALIVQWWLSSLNISLICFYNGPVCSIRILIDAQFKESPKAFSNEPTTVKPSTDQHTLIDLTNDSDDGEENKALVLTSLNQVTGNWHVPQSQSDSRHISDRKEMRQQRSRASVRRVRLRNRARRELLINNINLPCCRKKWCFLLCHESVLQVWEFVVDRSISQVLASSKCLSRFKMKIRCFVPQC